MDTVKIREWAPQFAGGTVMLTVLLHNQRLPLRRYVGAGLLGGAVSFGTALALELYNLRRREQTP